MLRSFTMTQNDRKVNDCVKILLNKGILEILCTRLLVIYFFHYWQDIACVQTYVFFYCNLMYDFLKNRNFYRKSFLYLNVCRKLFLMWFFKTNLDTNPM